MSENVYVQGVFNDLFVKYNSRFVRFAEYYVHDRMVAEDLVMESFMRFWDKREKLPEDANHAAYILTSVKNRCLNHLSSLQYHRQVENDMASESRKMLDLSIRTLEACNPEALLSQERREIIMRAIDSLPETTRNVFIRFRIDEQSYKEISEALGISTKSVEYELRKGEKMLRDSLKDYYPHLLSLFLWLLR
ncbi:MAG: RNA polymerase sigma-70 factor [Rikenellaceae bacterium]|nr:RNA polymerase sigma-70 factor [Rikenellaceae bacterium]